MEKQNVCYIHCHTKYSLKDGIADIPDYINKIKDLNKKSEKYNITGIGISEHGK